MHSRNPASTSPTAIACAAAVALGVAACSKPSTPAPEAAAPAAAETTPVGPSVQDEAASALAARAQELKAQEIELELRRRELAAQQAAAAAAAVRAAASPRPAAAPRPAASASATVPTSAAPPPPVVVPAGTQLSVQLAQACSTRTTPLGEPVVAVLTSDLVIDGRRVARAGAPLRGSVTEVTSGSRKVGAVPALKIDFTQLAVADGSTAAVNVRLAQKGPSEKGRDTAKIVGGTAAGAIIGHQIDGDHGSVIGGALGAAAGVAAAKHTGTEVELAAGSVVTATVRTAFEYRGK